MQTQNYLAAAQMISAMQHLRDQGKLTSNRALAASLRKVIADNSIQHPLAAPMGSKVIAVHKHPGDYVRRGEKIVTLLVAGKTVPILAKQDGVMQAINVSKGGILGNSLPTASIDDLNDGGLLIVSLINF
jgi:acetyl/propionyl-CoA carboxylase alpha subunit